MASGAPEHNKLVSRICGALDAYRIPHRIIVSGNPQGRRFLRRGRMVDIVAALPPTGRLLLIEAKTGAGKLTPEQQACFDEFDAVGAMSFEIRDLKDLDPVRRYMERLRPPFPKTNPSFFGSIEFHDTKPPRTGGVDG